MVIDERTDTVTVPHPVEVTGSPYSYDASLHGELAKLHDEVRALRASGELSPDALRRIRKYFRIKSIYNSNAIEGNQLSVGETRLVVEQGLTITGKPLKDTLEAKNLSHATDLLEELADRDAQPIAEVDIRNIHTAVLAGISDDDAGKYRTRAVEISGSDHAPTAPHDVPGEMREFALWLAEAGQRDAALDRSNPVVLAAAAHVWFVMIHPFVDGNGRTARILVNLILMRNGYPIAIITKDDRQRYYDALEEAQSSDLTPFITLVLENIRESLEEYKQAAQQDRQGAEWLASIVDQFTHKERSQAEVEYDIWKGAMDIVRGHFKQTAEALDSAAPAGLGNAYFRDFGQLAFEKFLLLRKGTSAHHTWFFRIDFRSGERAARYLFFFGFPSPEMQKQMGNTVTLHVATETTPFHFERLELMTSPDMPELVELGYDPEKEQYVSRTRSGVVAPGRIEDIYRGFIGTVIKRQF